MDNSKSFAFGQSLWNVRKSKASNDHEYQPRRLMPANGSQTKYMEMLLSLDKTPQLYNILCSCFTWILLAGFVVIPGSFTSLRKLQAKTNGEIIPGSPAANAVLSCCRRDLGHRHRVRLHGHRHDGRHLARLAVAQKRLPKIPVKEQYLLKLIWRNPNWDLV
ncbi:hypothetical protein V8F06_013608 [Rhypophila decipiens]